jgi:hypothetical protein
MALAPGTVQSKLLKMAQFGPVPVAFLSKAALVILGSAATY